MKQLLAAISMVLVASAASAVTQKIPNNWMDELTLYDVVWEDSAPAYQHWLQDNYESAEEAGEWRINKLKAAYEFNGRSYKGNHVVWPTDHSILTVTNYEDLNDGSYGFIMTLTDTNNNELYIQLEPGPYHEGVGGLTWAWDTYGDGWEVTHHDEDDVLQHVIQTLLDIGVPNAAVVILEVFPINHEMSI